MGLVLGSMACAGGWVHGNCVDPAGTGKPWVGVSRPMVGKYANALCRQGHVAHNVEHRP